jgi:riboflavin biosynthesis pyrimidine reductase
MSLSGQRDRVLELVFERPGLPAFGLPPELAALYGGDLGFERPRLYANFVSSLDGVVALRTAGDSGGIISGSSRADKFVMGLLRACADAVLLGAGTFRKTSGHRWHAEAIYPAAARFFADLRRRLGLRPQPPLVLVTGSGEVDVTAPALSDALIVTTRAGEAKLQGRLPPGARLLPQDSDSLVLAPVLERLRADGMGLVLTEGGPSLVGKLMMEGLLDELFLTSSPLLYGRTEGDGRKSLVEGVDLAGVSLDLLSARRDGSLLFLRYGRGAGSNVM